MSAIEHQRAHLDELMGTARDGSDSQRQHLHFTDSRVCRAFLLDCCPNDIFASTKLNPGECSKVHDPALRADYINANKTEDYMYEVSALERLQAFVNKADQDIDQIKRQLAETQKELTAEETSKMNRAHDLAEKLGKKLAQVDKADADNDLELKHKLIEEAGKIRREKESAEEEYKRVSRPASSHQHQNLRVCDICSLYLSTQDTDSRLADHFGGKLHLGFITVREKLEDLKKIVAEKRSSARRVGAPSDRTSNRERNSDRDRERDFDHDYDREYDHPRGRDYDRYRERDYDRYRDRDRDRIRDSRYHDRDRERDRSRSSSRYYREGRDSRPRDRYRDERLDRTDRSDRSDRVDRNERVKRSERHDSIMSSRSGRATYDRAVDSRYQEREITYQRRLREWEKREAEKARKHAIRISEERDARQLEEQESKKLKEFLEDYKDDRDDIRFYRASALARRLADRRKEIEHDELCRQREKMELEMLSRSCAINNSTPQQVVSANETAVITELNTSNGDNGKAPENSAAMIEPTNMNPSSTSSTNKQTSSSGQHKTSTEDKRKQVEELISGIPTDKDQLFARQLDWALLDENLMERRIRPWVTKKIAEYMGEKEVDLIDFVCTLLNNHTDGHSVLREVAIVLDDEAEKFVVHMWRLLIFELEAKKIGLRK